MEEVELSMHYLELEYHVCGAWLCMRALTQVDVNNTLFSLVN